jgi:signal transduction histidine kinase
MNDAPMKTEKILSAIVSVDYDYICLIDMNSRTYEIFTGKANERIPQKHSDYDKERTQNTYIYVVEEDRERLLQEMNLDYVSEQLKDKVEYTTEYRMTDQHGTFNKQDTFFFLDETHQDMVLMRKDITALTKRQQENMDRLEKLMTDLEKASDAKSEFLSNMSHDLRTPLNGILGFADIGVRTTDSQQKQEALEKIQLSGTLLLDLVNDTLELSRIESGKTVLEPEVVDSEKIGQSIIVSIRQMAAEKGVHFIADTDHFPCGKIYVDRLKLQKVALNLLSNAVKYTPKGGTVKYIVEAIDPPVNQMTRRIIVEDNGIGMSPAFLNHLYEPFVQEHRPEAKDIQGTGLGLAIVKKTVDLMHGTIAVESTMGKGTKFTVELPLGCPVEEMEKQTERPENQSYDFQGKHILLCEDNQINAEITTILLKQKNAGIDCAENGREGVDRFQKSPVGYYDAVLMDLRMPVMNGYDAVKAIRALDRKDAGTIKIIAMTADAFEDSIKAAKEAGMDDYLTKPVEPERLYQVLAKYIL